jgi:hypothetical protein
VTVDFRFDASDFHRLASEFAHLPQAIKAKAFSRAMRRMSEMARTQVVRESVKRTSSPPRIVQRATKATYDDAAASIDIKMRSGWIGIAQLNPRQTKAGVTTRLRGSYKSAFIATMKSGHRGVMIRGGKDRLPIYELFGPNPAHDIVKHPDEFLKVLSELIETRLAPRVLHEIENLLPR